MSDILIPYTAAGGLDFRNWQSRIGSLTEGFPNSQEISLQQGLCQELFMTYLNYHNTTLPQQLQKGRTSPKGKYPTWSKCTDSKRAIKYQGEIASSMEKIRKMVEKMKPRECHYCTENKNPQAKETPSVWKNKKPKQLQDTFL